VEYLSGASLRSLPLEWSPIWGSTLAGFSLACKYLTRVTVVTNTLAYYNGATITVSKRCIVQEREGGIILTINRGTLEAKYNPNASLSLSRLAPLIMAERSL
jgi:hypothetical protein